MLKAHMDVCLGDGGGRGLFGGIVISSVSITYIIKIG